MSEHGHDAFPSEQLPPLRLIRRQGAISMAGFGTRDEHLVIGNDK